MKRKRLLILAIFAFSMIILSSCKKKGKKELPVTEGYIELPKEKQKEINDSFKNYNHTLPISPSTIGDEYNEFMDAFDCAAIFDDYYFFAYTSKNSDMDSPIPELTIGDYYNIDGEYVFSDKMIVIYHNNKFSHNIEELFDLGIIDCVRLKTLLEFVNPDRDYSALANKKSGNCKNYNNKKQEEIVINDETKELINKKAHEFYPFENETEDYFMNNYTCIGKKGESYYFICNDDYKEDALVDPILYESNGIRMYSPGFICAFKNGELFLPRYHIFYYQNGERIVSGPIEINFKQRCMVNQNHYFDFEDMNDVELFKEIADNILSIRIKNGSWPENIGFPGQEL